MPRVFTLPCHCDSPSLAWRDHAATCPFARLGKNREAARRATRHLAYLMGAYAALIAAVLAWVALIR